MENNYKDGIKTFYTREEMPQLFKRAIEKNMFEGDPFKNRVYLVFKEMPDAKVGTVLRPCVNDQGELSEKPEYKEHYNYASKYSGRNTFLHREIVESEKNWFVRIN